MSEDKDTFDILAQELILIRRQVDHLQRTSLDKDDAEALNLTVTSFLERLEKVAPTMQTAIRHDLSRSMLDVRNYAIEAAGIAAREAIKEAHADSIKAARSLSKAAEEARREAWRYFGGFWVWLASVGVGGAALGLLAAFLITGRGDAREFGQYPGIYCTSAGGQIVEQEDGSTFCAIWIKPPSQVGG
jgi:hypothetical protein